MRVGQGDVTILFSSVLANVLWVMVVAALILPYWRSRKQEGVLSQSAQAGYES
jgi:TctA family transporter